MKKYNGFYSLKIFALVFIFILTVMSPTYASNLNDSSSPEKIIYQEIAAENENDWNALPSYWVKDQQDILLPFIADKQNRDNYIGLFNIKSAKISEIKEVSLDFAKKFIDVEKYIKEYNDIKVFYLGIDYTVNSESMFYYNGVNYRLAVVVSENGQWKLTEMGDVPVDAIVASKSGFGSLAEKTAEKIYQARHKGLFINPSGKVIDNNIASEAQKTIERGNMSRPVDSLRIDDHVFPSTINIYLTQSGNYSYYGYTGPTTHSIDFYYYEKNVLPNEWIASTWPEESLKAGAICVKMFGWYHVYYPKFPQYNAALTDRASDSQVFTVLTEHPRTTAAINATPFGLQTWDTYQIFETGYRAGAYDDSGYHSGIAYQNGSRYLADNGYGFYEILHYYYDYSPVTGNRMVLLFGY